jgi:hypothetical protein
LERREVHMRRVQRTVIYTLANGRHRDPKTGHIIDYQGIVMDNLDVRGAEIRLRNVEGDSSIVIESVRHIREVRRMSAKTFVEHSELVRTEEE